MRCSQLNGNFIETYNIDNTLGKLHGIDDCNAPLINTLRTSIFIKGKNDRKTKLKLRLDSNKKENNLDSLGIKNTTKRRKKLN